MSESEPRQLGVSGVFELIDLLSEQFLAEWTQGRRPSLESLLKQVPASARSNLLHNLLLIEIDQRRRYQESPTADEYLRRFPDQVRFIRQAFVESVAQVTEDATDPGRTISVARPAASRLGDYELIAKIGQGAFGVVWKARHLRQRHTVALKTLPLEYLARRPGGEDSRDVQREEGDRLHFFKREFRTLADINHPNLIGLHTLEFDAGQWFFTMDLVEGIDFLSYTRPHGALDEVRLRASLAQLVAGVMALHGHHIVHRDLKPSNVLVHEAGKVQILDFGLVVELREHAGNVTRIAGTPHYMAPEQAAGRPPTTAADWYAVGTMLYEALAGRRPYQADSWPQMLQLKQREDPRSLIDQPGVPADLADLCMRLLARDPQARPDALAIAKALSTQVSAAASPVSTGSQRLIGRESQLAALQTSLDTLRQQQEPQILFISGRSGEGKTSLAEQFLEPLRKQPRLTVLSGRCYDRESVPFKALDNLIDALCGHLRSLPGEDVALMLPDDIGFLTHLFPEMQRVDVIARKRRGWLADLDEQQVRSRAFAALRRLLEGITERAPLIMFIDDLQWGDADSAQALFEVLRPPQPPAILLLGSYRSDETEKSPFLQAWAELPRKNDVQLPRRDVRVGPLTQDQCVELMILQVGQDSEVVRRRAVDFFQETGGNPFFLIELISCFDTATDSFRPLPLNEMIDRKLQQLPNDARRLLEVVAVSGQALSMGELSTTAGQDAPAVATITHMRSEKLVRLVGAEDTELVDTYHDKIRETVLRTMPSDSRRATHRALADVIETSHRGLLDAGLERLEHDPLGTDEEQLSLPRVYDLSYHYDAGGETQKAWRYALLAAEQARRQSALEVAANQYALAQRNAGETSDGIRYRLAAGSGETWMLLGRYEEATNALQGALELVGDDEHKARIDLLQGDIAFKQGAIDRSVSFFQQGLRRLDNWVPRRGAELAYGIVREALIQCGHSFFPGRLHRSSRSRRRELAVRLHNSLSLNYIFQDSFKCLWAHLSGLNRAELLPASSPLLIAFGLHACWSAMFGWQKRSAAYSERTVVTAREVNDIWGLGLGYTAIGIGLYASARYEESLGRLHEALRIFEKAGDKWAFHLARFHKGCCHYGRGELADAIAEARATIDSSASLGDSRAMCASYLWARATRGNIPFEALESCYPCRPDDVMSTAHGVMAKGLWHAYHGRTGEELAAFERAAEMIKQNHCINSHMIVVMPMLAAACRRHAETVQAEDAGKCRQLRRRALRLARWSARLTRLFPAAHPLSLRELALCLAANRKTKQALRAIDRSLAVSQRQQARYEHAQSLLVRGRLAQQLGRSEAAEQIRAAEETLEALERPAGAAASPRHDAESSAPAST